MFWLRTLAYLMPLGLGFAGFLLLREVERLELPREGEALVTAIQKPIGSLAPLGAIDGVSREIRDLVFDPLLRRDENYVLRPHLIDSWSFRTIVTLHCSSEEDAGEVEALIHSHEYRPQEGIVLEQSLRNKEIVTLGFEGFAEKVEERFLDQIDREKLANFEVVILQVEHSVETFFEAFLKSSVEKKRIRMVDFSDDTIVTIFVGEEVGPLLEELNLYLDSNSDLNPRVQLRGKRSHVVAREAIFRLRDDVFWHDGVKLTAEDVLFSLEQYAGEGARSPLSGLFWFAESIERRGDFEIQILCKSLPSPGFVLECWEQLPVLPKHYFEQTPLAEAWARFHEFPVGTGPYLVTERFRSGGIKLSAHDAYVLGSPEQREIVYRRFDSLESKLLALRSFRIDALVPDDRFVLWSKRNPGEVERARCISRFQHFVLWNRNETLYRDLEFRTALAESVDSSKWIGESSASYLAPVGGLFHTGLSFEPGPMALPSYDPVKAANQLESLGLKYDEKKGIRRNREGDPLVIRLTVNQENPDQVFLASSLADQWQALGIRVETETLPLSSILMDRLVPGEFSAVLLSWEIPRGRDRFKAFHSQMGGEEGANLFGLENQRVDRLVEVLRHASDEEEIAEAAKNLQKEIVALQPCLFIAESGRFLWFRKDGIKATPPEGVTLAGQRFPFVGPDGVARSRPWWVRIKEESQKADGDDP